MQVWDKHFLGGVEPKLNASVRPVVARWDVICVTAPIAESGRLEFQAFSA